MATVLSLSIATNSFAATLKPLSLNDGCRLGRKYVSKFAARHPNSLDDYVIERCYRRDRYRVVTETTYYWSDGAVCSARGIVTETYSQWRWRQYGTGCA